MYQFIEFPKMLYSKTSGHKIVESREEQDACDPEWLEVLAFFAEEPEQGAVSIQSKKKSKKGVEE